MVKSGKDKHPWANNNKSKVGKVTTISFKSSKVVAVGRESNTNIPTNNTNKAVVRKKQNNSFSVVGIPDVPRVVKKGNPAKTVSQLFVSKALTY
jgi:hypothetical protein